MAQSKLKSSKSKVFVKGGSGHMFGQQHAGPQAAGTTARKAKGTGGKFIKGGNTKMAGFTGVKAAKPK